MTTLVQTASCACSCDVLTGISHPEAQLTASREHLARLLYWCVRLQCVAMLPPVCSETRITTDACVPPRAKELDVHYTMPES